MRRLLPALCFCLLSFSLSAQSFGLKDITHLLELGRSKQEDYLRRRGFIRENGGQEGGPLFARSTKEQEEMIHQALQLLTDKDPGILFQTTSPAEQSLLLRELTALRFEAALPPDSTLPLLYQRAELSVQYSQQRADSLMQYTFLVRKKRLPKEKEIVFAEDLLQLDAHSYLAAFFGEANVRADEFAYSATSSRKSSVLFPGTAREVVFVWQDELNRRGIEFIVVGEHRELVQEATNAVRLSAWQSRQGIRCGMGVQEVERLHGQPIQYYNWNNEAAGCLYPSKKGGLDFESVKLLFQCMNCFSVDSRQELSSSTEAIRQGQKVFVKMFIVFPGS
jgi:hypothetical protein